MSVIVCVKGAGRVCMACDSQATNNGAKATLGRAAAKIHRRGTLVFGAPSLAIIDAVRWHMPEPGELAVPLQDWAATVFIPWLRGWLKDRDLMERSKDGELFLPAGVFVAHGGDYALVDTGSGVIVFDDAFRAMGSGWGEAHGAMWQAMSDADGTEYMHDRRSADAAVTEYIARQGVLAAIALDSGCGPPVVVEWTHP